MSLPQTPSGGTPRLRRGAVAACAVVLSTAALTACGAGNNAESLGIKPDNPSVTVDTISVQNANVITQPESGKAGPAAVSATIFNKGNEDQTVDSIALQGGGSAKLSPAQGAGPVVVPAQGKIVIGGQGNPSAVIEDGLALTKNIGGVQNVVFGLSKTGAVKLDAFVVPSASYYKDFGPSAAPSPAAAPASPANPADESGQPATGASAPASP
ncbi:lipoprotein, partial [Streptomyces clavuligerus]